MAWARLVAKLVAALMLVGIAAIFAAWAIVEHEAAPRIHASLAELAPAKAGLVLGTSRLAPGREPNGYFENRIDAAAELFSSGKVEYLIVSGNQSQGGRPVGGYDEPNDMRDALIAAGVPADRIYRDYAGFRTLDSVLRAREVFGQDRVIVVSQRFHLIRALYIASQHGLMFDGFEAQDVPLSHGYRTQWREMFARLRAVLDGALGLGPRFGGAKIQIGVDRPS